MKKITKLIACLGLAFTLVACSGAKVDDKALDQLEAVIQNITRMGSFDYELTFDAKQDSVEAQVKLTGAFKTEGGLEASANVDFNADGQTMEKLVQLYFTDNAMFMRMLGQKQQTPIDLDALSSIPVTPFTSAIDKEAIKEILTSASVKGNVTSFEFDIDQLNEANNKTNATDALSSLTQTKTEEFKEFTVELTTTDNLIDKAVMHIVAIADGEEIEVDLTMTFSNINKVDTIEFPTDLDTYPVSEEDLLGEDLL